MLQVTSKHAAQRGATLQTWAAAASMRQLELIANLQQASALTLSDRDNLIWIIIRMAAALPDPTTFVSLLVGWATHTSSWPAAKTDVETPLVYRADTTSTISSASGGCAGGLLQQPLSLPRHLVGVWHGREG